MPSRLGANSSATRCGLFGLFILRSPASEYMHDSNEIGRPSDTERSREEHARVLRGPETVLDPRECGAPKVVWHEAHHGAVPISLGLRASQLLSDRCTEQRQPNPRGYPPGEPFSVKTRTRDDGEHQFTRLNVPRNAGSASARCPDRAVGLDSKTCQAGPSSAGLGRSVVGGRVRPGSVEACLAPVRSWMHPLRATP